MQRMIRMSAVAMFVMLAVSVQAETAEAPLLPDTTIDEKHEFIKSIGEIPGAVRHIGDKPESTVDEAPPERDIPAAAVTIPLPSADTIVRSSKPMIAPAPVLLKPVPGTIQKPATTVSAKPDSVKKETPIAKQPVTKASPVTQVDAAKATKATDPKKTTAKKVVKKGASDHAMSAKTAGQSIVSVIRSDGNFKTLAKYLRLVGLNPMLETKGKYTFFAPTDAAFKRVSRKYLAHLERPENRDKLLQILANHIIGGKRLTNVALSEMRETPATMAGESLVLAEAHGKLQVDRASIIAQPISSKNGIIHVVDQVLLPTSLLSDAATDGDAVKDAK